MIIQHNNLDTTPGCGAMFAPPSGFEGDYSRWLSGQVHASLEQAQCLLVSARFYAHFHASGPYAQALENARRATLEAGRVLDTASGLFAPPTPVSDYRAWVRGRYRDPGFAQTIHRIAMWCRCPKASGPYATELEGILQVIHSNRA